DGRIKDEVGEIIQEVSTHNAVQVANSQNGPKAGHERSPPADQAQDKGNDTQNKSQAGFPLFPVLNAVCRSGLATCPVLDLGQARATPPGSSRARMLPDSGVSYVRRGALRPRPLW